MTAACAFWGCMCVCDVGGFGGSVELRALGLLGDVGVLVIRVSCSYAYSLRAHRVRFPRHRERRP